MNAAVLLNFLEVNKIVNYNLIIPALIAYVVLFWLIVSLWVYFDAKKRLANKRIALLLCILNMIFLLPFLVLYLLARPVDREEFAEITQAGGVNVPIVNFVGKEGVVMSLELRLNSSRLADTKEDSEMKIDVSFTSADPNKEMLALAPVNTDQAKTIKGNNIFNKLGGKVANFKQSVAKKFGTLGTKAQAKVKENTNQEKKKDEKDNGSPKANKDDSGENMNGNLINKIFRNQKKKNKKRK